MTHFKHISSLLLVANALTACANQPPPEIAYDDQVLAQVTSKVFDSPSDRYLLIPQGARLLGEYDSRIAFVQNRLLLVWTRLILPDGHSIVLGREPGTDGSGAAGLQGFSYLPHWQSLHWAPFRSKRTAR